MKLYEKTATQLVELLDKKQCNTVEIIESIYQRIDEVESTIGAFVELTKKEEALQQALMADKKRANGEHISPLCGIPIGIKDNICTKQVTTTCCSKMLNNFIPPYDATVVEALKGAGMISIGKLNMDEFAMGSSTETSAIQITRNPHDLSRVPGGSSGGSAACVSAGEVPLSLGSDTGGSIRLPASYCGVVGLKPTYGSVSRYGLIAFASSLDQIGPIGRSVMDVAMLLEVIVGHDSKDATSAQKKYPRFASQCTGSIRGKVIGLPKEFFGSGVSEEVKIAVQQVAKMMQQQGAILKEISLPSASYSLNAYYIISSAEASSNLARFDGVKYGYRAAEYKNLTDLYEKSRSESFGDEVKRRIMLGSFVLSSGYYDAYYHRAKLLQQKIEEEFLQQFTDCDVILTPTSPDIAFRLGENLSDPLKMYAADLCTTTANMAGLPAITMPCGTDQNGLPIGCQLIGAKFSEQTLLNLAFGYEQQVGGFESIAKCK